MIRKAYNSVLMFASALAAAALLAGCARELTEIEEPQPADGIRFMLADNNPKTRVAYDSGYKSSHFEVGDVVGIFTLDAEGGNAVSGAPLNAQYAVAEGEAGTDGTATYVLEPVSDNVPSGHTYVIYYPYDEAMTLETLKSYTFQVQANQNPAADATENPYEQSDLLWDVTADDDNDGIVEVAMDHAMACIVLEINSQTLVESLSTVYNIQSVTITARYMQVTEADLSVPYTDTWAYTPAEVTSSTTVTMENFSYDADLNRGAFRAVIPGQRYTSSDLFFTFNMEASDGTSVTKTYNMPGTLGLMPNHIYIFTIANTSEGGEAQPELSDESSWVYDVLDPETGEQIGLLCREYLRYQPLTQNYEGEAYNPNNGTNYTSADLMTGVENADGTINLNSQAWVFYNMKTVSGVSVPDLSTGTVLRFIYDVQQPGWVLWPAPHTNKWGSGLFTPVHGHTWSNNADKTQGESGDWRTGPDEDNPWSDTNQPFLHGGTITWDGTTNKITSFTKPTNLQITNEVAAANGHIAIPTSGDPFVSYSSLTGGTDVYHDAEGNKIGLIIEHFLVDTRTDSEGDHTNNYPLVKIGYNQFWMSKTLRAVRFTDGTSMTCYNSKEGPGITFAGSGTAIGAGYMYGFGTFDDNGTNKTYDPYNDETQMHPDGDFTPSPLYNREAVTNDNFLAVPNSDAYTYSMPTVDEMDIMFSYFGYGFGAKLCTNDIAVYNTSEGAPNESNYSAVLYGRTWGTSGSTANSFTANISGFNLKARGWYYPETGNMNSSLGADAVLMLLPTVSRTTVVFNLASYDPWQTRYPVSTNTYNENYFSLNETGTFAQVRFYMSFKHQDTSSSTTSNGNLVTRSSDESRPSRNIYIMLK